MNTNFEVEISDFMQFLVIFFLFLYNNESVRNVLKQYF